MNIQIKKIYLFFFITIVSYQFTKAEVTKDISSTEPDLTTLLSLFNQSDKSYFNYHKENWIYFRDKKFNTEIFYFGLNAHLYSIYTIPITPD